MQTLIKRFIVSKRVAYLRENIESTVLVKQFCNKLVRSGHQAFTIFRRRHGFPFSGAFQGADPSNDANHSPPTDRRQSQ